MVRVIELIAGDTGNMMQANGTVDVFWIKRSMKQECPLSLTLFSLHIVNVEKCMKRGQYGGVVVGRKKFL